MSCFVLTVLFSAGEVLAHVAYRNKVCCTNSDVMEGCVFWPSLREGLPILLAAPVSTKGSQYRNSRSYTYTSTAIRPGTSDLCSVAFDDPNVQSCSGPFVRTNLHIPHVLI
jgi:hypothetical protein